MTLWVFEIWDHYSCANLKSAILSMDCDVSTDYSPRLSRTKISLISVFLPSAFFLGALLKIYHGEYIITGPLKRTDHLESYIYEKLKFESFCVLEQMGKMYATTSHTCRHYQFSQFEEPTPTCIEIATFKNV